MFVELLERKIGALNGSVGDERGAKRILNERERNSDRIRGGRKALQSLFQRRKWLRSRRSG